MRIQHNIMAMSAYRNYTNNVSAMKKNLEKLSSGYKINRAGDDAAGLAISEKMRAQITGLETAQKNAKDGISLVQTAEGALTEVHDMLNRMVELATQSANGTYEDTTDRTQLQKEVDQLLSEINRIADSSNFNGINLLDGSLGLNKAAFTNIDVAAAVPQSGGEIAGSKLALNDGELHTEKAGNTASVAPGFKINLNDLAFKATGAGNIKLSVLGKEFTINTTATGGNAGGADYGAVDIAKELIKQFQTSTDGIIGVDKTTGATNTTAATNNDAIKIGDMVFSYNTPTNGEITFTYEGYMKDGTTFTAKTGTGTAEQFTEDQAKAINEAIGAGVKYVSSTAGTKTGDVVHDTTNVDYAQAITPSTLAGVDIDLSSIVGQGNSLTIDGKTFYFQTEAGAANKPKDEDGNAVADADIIDVSKGKTDAEKVHMAVDLLSKQGTITGQTDGTNNGRTWVIASAGDSKIHIEQTAATTDTTKALKDFDAVAGVISAKTPVVAAKNVGTKITVDESMLADGNTLNIGGEKFVYTDDFTDKQSLANAINANAKLKDKYTAEVDGDDVIIRAKDAAGVGPMVLGKGLTLQIGDTSDTWNQLNVAVQDMHAKSLGIDGLKINTEESAQAAIKKIKDAINTVSDVRGTLGATQNRLDHTINNLSVMTENIQDAESTIRDVDVAEEMMAYTKNNILIQSAQAMLAQANQVPQGVLQLLQ